MMKGDGNQEVHIREKIRKGRLKVNMENMKKEIWERLGEKDLVI